MGSQDFDSPPVQSLDGSNIFDKKDDKKEYLIDSCSK